MEKDTKKLTSIILIQQMNDEYFDEDYEENLEDKVIQKHLQPLTIAVPYTNKDQEDFKEYCLLYHKKAYYVCECIYKLQKAKYYLTIPMDEKLIN